MTAYRSRLRHKATRTLVRVALCATVGTTATVLCAPTVWSAPTDSYAVTATIPVNGLAEGIAISPDGSRAYVTHGDDGAAGQLSVIDTATKTVLNTLAVGNFPVGVTVSPNGQTVYAGSNGDDTVSVIDTTTFAVTATIPRRRRPTRRHHHP